MPPATARPLPQGARHSTAQMATSYLGPTGRLMGNPQNRGWMHQTVGQWLRVARNAAEIRRVMDVWRHIHYLGKGGGNVFRPKTIRLHYYLDLPALRAEPVPWYPAAAVTIRYALPGGIPSELGLESPLQALEIARNYVADDIREIRDLSPEILREVVRRMRLGSDWAAMVKGRVLWQPQWLLSFSDPGAGHDGGLYRGAGAMYLGARSGGKEVWGWPLSEAARKVSGAFEGGRDRGHQ